MNRSIETTTNEKGKIKIRCVHCGEKGEISANDIHMAPNFIYYDFYCEPLYFFQCPCCGSQNYFTSFWMSVYNLCLRFKR